jgi:hypothetical protein
MGHPAIHDAAFRIIQRSKLSAIQSLTSDSCRVNEAFT